jgi:pimeloyl-ACP methyl ester carboxylesterase
MLRILRILFPRHGYMILLACIVCFSSTSAAAPPDLKNLTAAARTRIDRLAQRYPLDSLKQQKREAVGNLPLWALSHLALSAEDEVEHARAARKEILNHERKRETPAAARRMLDQLLKKLPPSLKQEAFEYELIVLDRPDAAVFTLGGGIIYLSSPLLAALLSDKERGETALAFVLAHQLGHMSLQHTRRGWQMYELEQELQKGIALHVARPALREALHTGVQAAGERLRFLYTRLQIYEADQFARQLCRNADLPADAALDALRWLAVVDEPSLLDDDKYSPKADDPKRDTPPVLLRLRRLFMERDGLVDDKKDIYGLFIWKKDGDGFERCARESVAAGDKAVVFVHGFRGDMQTFRAYVRAFADDRDLSRYKLLVFRYPNNAGLERSGQFLVNEMRRVVAAPEKTVFVCHSAGGLVFRWYAEIRKQPFDRAVLLSTPNDGTNMTSLKYLADVSTFFDEWKNNGPGALARMLPEGEGQLVLDVSRDSLFLHYLGQNADLAQRYHVFSGEYMRPAALLAMEAGLVAGKRVLLNRLLPRMDSTVLRRQIQRRIEKMRIPAEITRGDLVVSADSALLKNAGHSTRTALNHEQFKTDENVIEDVTNSLRGK